MIRLTIMCPTTQAMHNIIDLLTADRSRWSFDIDMGTHTVVDDVYDDEPGDDETATDINLLLSHDNGLSRKVDEIAAEHNVSRSVAVQVLGQLWAKPEIVIEDVDIAPPHGFPRPEQFRTKRVKPTDTGAHAYKVKYDAIEKLSCPRCGAQRTEYCKSPKGATSGVQFVHAARLNLYYGDA